MCTHLIIDLLGLVLRSSYKNELLKKMYINVAPILENIYLAMFENELLKKCDHEPKVNWPILLRRFMIMVLDSFVQTIY